MAVLVKGTELFTIIANHSEELEWAGLTSKALWMILTLKVAFHASNERSDDTMINKI